MYINNHYHSNLGKLDMYTAKYAVAYTEQFNQDCVKFFKSLAQAYKFSFKCERPRFFYRTSDYNLWQPAGICYCSCVYTIFDDYDKSPVIFDF